jgi:predicted transcriptional regulator
VLAGKPAAQRQRISASLEVHGPLNRRMIAQAVRLPISSVCWRVKGMLQSDLLRVAYVSEDPVTGQETEFLETIWPQLKQKSFEGFLR